MQLLQEPEYLPYLVAIFCRSAHEFLVGRLGCWFHHRLIAERDDGEDYITFQGLAASLLGLSGDQAITAPAQALDWPQKGEAGARAANCSRDSTWSAP